MHLYSIWDLGEACTIAILITHSLTLQIHTSLLSNHAVVHSPNVSLIPPLPLILHSPVLPDRLLRCVARIADRDHLCGSHHPCAHVCLSHHLVSLFLLPPPQGYGLLLIWRGDRHLLSTCCSSSGHCPMSIAFASRSRADSAPFALGGYAVSHRVRHRCDEGRCFPRPSCLQS